MISRWMQRRGSWKMVERLGREYLERYYLLKAPLRPLPEAYFYHIFHMDDPDPLHDHPWPWGRVIVRGSYRECYMDGTSAVFGPGHIVWRRQSQVFHRVELLTPTVHTIFWHWGRDRAHKSWGFMRDGVWVDARETGEADSREMRGWLFPRFIK
jgi:hypothetical protein